MKIGVLTYHRADNFGAVLQAYALITFLRQKGFDAEIIDYRYSRIEAQYHLFNPTILFQRKNIIITLREYLKRFLNIKDRLSRKRKFELFREHYLPQSQSYRKIVKPLKYDLIITGSDQVWNFHLNKGSEAIYLLDFPVHEATRKVAYAASSERNGLARIDKMKLKDSLDKFFSISVREDFLRDELRRIVNRRIEVCIDPTFLLDKEQYLRIANKPSATGYIFVYHMTYVPEWLPFIKEIAERKGLKVVEIYGGFNIRNSDTLIANWGPLDVIGYIANAEMVFTTSFHGLALSLILNKDVWVVNKGDNLRQRNMLGMAGLSDRLLNDPNDYSGDSIDYAEVMSNLSPYIEKSKNFLKFDA